jgi:hypothetical protein
MSNPAVNPSRISKSALFSLIFGILGCIPFVTSILAIVLGIIGFFAAGKPGMRGRWMAVVGILLAVISIGLWSTVGIALVWRAGGAVVTVVTAPGHGVRDFIRAVDSGDEAGARNLCVMNEADFTAARTLIKAQGGFVDSTFNEVDLTNDEGHVSGSGEFKGGTRQISGDVVKIDGKWKVKSLTIMP